MADTVDDLACLQYVHAADAIVFVFPADIATSNTFGRLVIP